MSQQALLDAEHPELRTMAEEIIEDQPTEIAPIESWRGAWYPDLASTEGLSMSMGGI